MAPNRISLSVLSADIAVAGKSAGLRTDGGLEGNEAKSAEQSVLGTLMDSGSLVDKIVLTGEAFGTEVKGRHPLRKVMLPRAGPIMPGKSEVALVMRLQAGEIEELPLCIETERDRKNSVT